MVIGLTGGIGCGKSAAAAFFAELGFQVIDADKLARQVLESPGGVAQLQARWGRACLDSEGLPNRVWIAAKVFSDPVERDFLELLIHPEVARLRRDLIAQHGGDTVVEIPLLFEKNLGAEFSKVVCIASSDAIRRERLRGRGLSVAQINARVSSQLTMEQKVKMSNWVIWNDGTLSFLRQQVAQLVARLRGAENR
jgi:dephospho-CoA kinase